MASKHFSYLYLGDYLEVAKICSKKNDPKYSSLASLAAKKCNCFDLQSLEATSAIFKCFENGNIEQARLICEDNNNLKILNLIFHIYHLIHKLESGEIDLNINILSHIKESFKTNNWVFPSSVPLLFNKYVCYKNRQEVLSVVTQELTLAFCTKKNDEVYTHLIRALSTCSRYTPNLDTEVHPLCNLCHWLSPGGYLSPFGFFTCQNTRFYEKVKSLRAFLCASIIRCVSDNRETRDNTEFFDVLRELQGDLMDRESYNYFKNLLQVEICEKRILKNRSLLLRNALTESEKIESAIEKSETGSDGNQNEAAWKKIEPTETRIIDDEMENSKTHSAESSASENGAGSLKKEPAEESGSEKNENTEPDSTEKPKEDEISNATLKSDDDKSRKSDASCEENSSNADPNDKRKLLENKIHKDAYLLRKLRNAIEIFERERVSAPNPVPNYFLLKKFCEGFPHNKVAVTLLKELEENWNNFY